MLKSTDYKTKVMKPKDAEQIAVLPESPQDYIDPPKVDPPKPDKQPTTNDRITALEKVVCSAFALNEDGTARKLKKKVKR